MQMLNHENLVNLIEVLDDPINYSIYMVLEICHKGIIMQIDLNGTFAKPYSEAQCRKLFRDLISAIEYLHTQGIVHRDIKPENLLLTKDNILKIADFGASQTFKDNNHRFNKENVGSPAFIAPEVLTPGTSVIPYKATDIWAMGVTLYCLYFGRLPFEAHNLIELYNKIRIDTPHYPDNLNSELRQLFQRILDKNPETRICMIELKCHSWVTANEINKDLTLENTIKLTKKDVKSKYL